MSQCMYKSGGPFKWDGKDYTLEFVDESQVQAMIEAGWLMSHDEANAAAQKNDSPVDTSPPTREELETKAKELGIKYDGRTTDKKLSALIDDALKG